MEQVSLLVSYHEPTQEQRKLAHFRKKGSSKGETGHKQEDNTHATQNIQGQEDDKLVLW